MLTLAISFLTFATVAMVRRLRTSTGCIECRRRKKKCTEQKPKCAACLRLGFDCSWPTDQQHTLPKKSGPPCIMEENVNIVQLPSLASYQTSSIANGYISFKSDADLHFATLCPSMVSMSLSPVADAEWRNTNRYMSLILSQPPIRSACVAFAARIRSMELQKAMPISRLSYQRAVSNLQGIISQHLDTQSILPTITAMTFMGLYEESHIRPNLTSSN